MIKTRFTEMFGVEKPIVQGGMHWIGVPEFASVVCNNGAIGTINRAIYADPRSFDDALEEMESLTSKPYFVNISLTRDLMTNNDVNKYIDICIDHHVAGIEFAAGNPKDYIEKVKRGGVRLIHKSPNAHVSQSMARKGADVITIAGYEVAGHPSMDGIGTFVIANRVASLVDVPVLAAGGVADGKGLAAALALGCEGVVMGTRLVATDECPVSDNHKNWVIEHTEKDTVITQKSIGSANRVANNMAAKLTLEMEKRGTTIEELMDVISGKRGKVAYETGDVDGAIFALGPAMGLVHEIKPVGDVLSEMVEEAESIIKRLDGQITE